MERRAWLAWALGLSVFASGCSSLAIPVGQCYDSSPNEWVGQMPNQSTRSRMPKSSEGAGAVDQPSHLTPDRVHGGIGP